jgi:hypothetical protein
VDRVHGCVLHDATWYVAHMNFADELACLTANNIWNEVVTIHRSQEVLKMLSSLHLGSFCINCLVKKPRYSNPSCNYSTPDTNFCCILPPGFFVFKNSRYSFLLEAESTPGP